MGRDLGHGRVSLDGRSRSLTRHYAVSLMFVAGAMGLLRSPLHGQIPRHGGVPTGLDLYMPAAEGGLPTGNVVVLGRSLFFDPILSSDSTIACATCHNPEKGFSDGKVVAVGVNGRRGTRNVPAIVNRGYGFSFFWDGRAATLEEQVVMPIQSGMEMGSNLDDVVDRLTRDAGYSALFRATHGSDPNRATLARSLAAYVRTIRSGASPFDRFMDGDPAALSELEIEGLRLFQGRAGCDKCHLGASLTDEKFHNTGVAYANDVVSDSGRAAVTGHPEDLGAFKVPTLREVARTAPYMHDGSLATLAGVIEFYDRGGNANPSIDPLLRTLDLSDEEKRALVAFLQTLTGEVWEGVR